MPNPKQSHYESLLKRMAKAHDEEHYFEASWYAYAILEDRLRSALRSSGGDTYANHRPIRTLGRKMQIIRDRKANDTVLAAMLTDALMDRIYNWKESRNDLMHAMADGSKSLKEVDKEIYLLSGQSSKLIRDVAAACRRLKKRKAKQP